MKAARQFIIFLLLAAACIQTVQTQVVRRRPIFPASNWTPANLGSTVKLWLEADIGTGGTTSGDVVSTWTDQSSNAANATGSGAARPTYQTGVINGKPVVRFDGSDDVLTFGDKFSSLTTMHVFLVVKITSDPPASDYETGLWDFSTAGSATHFPYTDGTVYDSFGSTARKDTVNPTPAMTSAVMYSVLSKSSWWQNHVNGTALYTTAANTVACNTAPSLGKSLGSYYLKGDIALIIICNAELSGGDLTSMKTYIANKYGLTIS